PGRLGLGAVAPSKEELQKDVAPLGKATKKALNRRRKRDEEEAEYAAEGRARLLRIGGSLSAADGGNGDVSEDDVGRASATLAKPKEASGPVPSATQGALPVAATSGRG
ncbi:unnamed protein product, partial [Polarella glacialis]